MGDCQVPLACTKFLEKKGKELLDKNLYRNFVVHMCSLFDYGLVSPVALYQTMQQLHELITESHAKAMQSCWEAQKEHWIMSGAKEKQNTPSHFKNQVPPGIITDPSVRRKLYSPGSYKSESPNRRKTQQQNNVDDEEDEEEDDDEEEEEEENVKAGIIKSSCSSSSASSTSCDSVVTKKNRLAPVSDIAQKKNVATKSGLTSGNNFQGQSTQGKPSLNQNAKSQTSVSSNGDGLKRKAPPSRGTSPSPVGSKLSIQSTSSQNNVKSLGAVSNEPPAKKKIVSTQPNGKPQAVPSQNSNQSNELKRKLSVGADVSTTSTSSSSDLKNSLVNGVMHQTGKGTSCTNDPKKRSSLPSYPPNGVKSTTNNVTSPSTVNCDIKKKSIPNGINPLTDGKLVSNCTVEMVPISDDLTLSNSVKSGALCGNDAKRVQNPNVAPSSQGDNGNGPQRRKSICVDSPSTSDSSMVLFRRKSFSNNQSTESSPIQTLAAKGVAS